MESVLLASMGFAAAAVDSAVALVFIALWRTERQSYLIPFGLTFACLATALVAASAGRWAGRMDLTEPLADAFYIASIALQAGGCLELTKWPVPWIRLMAGAACCYFLVQILARFGLSGFVYAPCLAGLVYIWLAVLFLIRRKEGSNALLGVLFAFRALVNLSWPIFSFTHLVAVVLNADQVFVVTTALVLIVFDLTSARRRVENANRELSGQAEALTRLNVQLAEERRQATAANRAKSLFLANMSHELRTPLNAVIGFSDLIANSRIPNAAEQSVEYARLINTAGQHLLGIINDVLDMSRIETGNINLTSQRMNLRAVLDAVVSLVLHQARDRSIGFSAQIADGAAGLEADEQLIKQVLINVLSNAFKYTEPGGAVRLEAAEAGPDTIVITVTDTGLGIAAADLPRIFEPFVFSGSAMTRRRGGIGLGLSITKRLVELHGGTISIASVLGKGTTVTIVLPKRQGGTPAAERAAPRIAAR